MYIFFVSVRGYIESVDQSTRALQNSLFFSLQKSASEIREKVGGFASCKR